MAHRSMVMVKRTYLHISVISLITAMLWTTVSIYQSLTSPSEVVVDTAIRTPISPTLDQEVLTNILSREDLSELAFAPPEATPSAVVINEVVPVASESSSIPDQSEAVITESTPE